MIHKLEWDSDFFGIEIGEITYGNKFDNQDSYDLLYINNDIDFEIEIENFTNSFSETKLIFSKDIIKSDLKTYSIFSIKNIEYKKKEIYDLAYESGKFSRFFLDNNFSKDKFEKLYQKWVDNSISNEFADDLLVFLDDDHIVGFVTYKRTNRFARIGLIGVSPNHQGKGIGKKLLSAVENILYEQKVKTMFIPTQEKNEVACRFYKKQGYNIAEEKVIKHYWKNDTI